MGEGTGQGPRDDVAGVPPASERPGVPRWVKVFVVVAAVVALLVIALMLLSGGTHGPGRHLSGQGASPASTSIGSSVLVMP